MDGAVGPDLRAEAADHLVVASAARTSGDVDAMRTALVAAFVAARGAGATEVMATAALAMPASQRFGVYPGQIPALLHEAYEATEDAATRCRLAAALSRSWVYGGDAVRAVRFSEDAQRLAAEVARPEVTADALDAALVAHWGPDDFPERVSLAARLDEVAAHLTDPELRLSAHLWRLTTAWECLDIVSVRRQLRALDVVADESGSPRAEFFATSRRAMYALATDDLDTANQLIARTAATGAQLAEPDVEAVLHELRAERARMAGDLAAIEAEAAAHEAFGTAEGISSISAVGAALWSAAGAKERAARLVSELTSGGIDAIPRDVDFLLVVTSVVGVAARVGLVELARDGMAALEPFAGRGVLNAGAVVFHGVVDDYLCQAGRALGDDSSPRWYGNAQSAYRRIGAGWWSRALDEAQPPRAPTSTRTLYLRREDDGGWSVGAEGRTFALADRRGLHYLRLLVEQPGVDVAVLALSAAVAGHPGRTVDEADLGAVLDARALGAYRRRLAQIDGELDAADVRGDQARARALSTERDALIDQVRGASGLGGRARRTGASTERARVAVRKAIASTLSQIDQHDPGLGHLLRGSIRTGLSCRYDPSPDDPVLWVTT